jgi:hypothetical protein
VSRRDLLHVLTALADLTGADRAAGAPVAEIDSAIGRGRNDMRTPLNLQSLRADGHVTELPDGRWAVTPEGADWLDEDRRLSDR